MAETKSYNPKTANIVCQYQVANDNDRLFIPMLENTVLNTGPATMEEQLAQCKRLSPHGTSKDVQPDGPLEFYQSGSINGVLLIGKTLTAQPGKAKGGEPPYTYTYQWKIGTSGTGPWSDYTGATSTTYVIKEEDVGKYFMFETTVTDSLDTKVSVVTPQSWGPVASVYATVVGPESPVDLYTGHTAGYQWYGTATYDLGWNISYKDGSGIWRTMVKDTDYSTIVNDAIGGGLDLDVLSWKNTSANYVVLTVQADFTQQANVPALEIRGCATDTKGSLNTSDCADLTINFIGF